MIIALLIGARIWCLWYGYSMDLATQVRQYYLDNFNQLPQDKQFHFASRLAAWNNDPVCKQQLAAMKSYVLPPETTTTDMLRDVLHNLPETPINAATERAPYFAKYPSLRGLMLSLFRVRHLLSIYNTDVREEFLQITPLEELQNLADTLLHDEAAMRVLSTYAINFLYLIRHILYPDKTGPIDTSVFYTMGRGYDLSQKSDTLLLIYLYTHCIIGETNFYERPVAPERQAIYLEMIQKVEEVIKAHYDDCNLDNKLEFLVCCRILGYDTSLEELIYEECEGSISPEGTFLVDTLNNAGQTNKVSFADSEHRNVLFIMSTSPYKVA